MPENGLPEAGKCPAQVAAAVIVDRQLDRSKQKLLAKKITPLFCFELYILNCDLHEGPAHHIDLALSDVGNIGPQGLPHVIAAMENLLKTLKARAT